MTSSCKILPPRGDSAEIATEYGLSSSEQVEALVVAGLFPEPVLRGTKTSLALWERTEIDRYVDRLRFNNLDGDNGVVYFIGCDAFIKIGFTTYLERRLRSIRTASPHPIVMLGSFAGTKGDEKSMHRICRSFKVEADNAAGTEWFHASRALKLFICWLHHINCKQPSKELTDFVDSVQWFYPGRKDRLHPSPPPQEAER